MTYLYKANFVTEWNKISLPYLYCDTKDFSPHPVSLNKLSFLVTYKEGLLILFCYRHYIFTIFPPTIRRIDFV
jgi:hypothetical protein